MRYYNRMNEILSIININEGFRGGKYIFSENEEKNEILKKYLVSDEVLENLKDILNFYNSNRVEINKL